MAKFVKLVDNRLFRVDAIESLGEWGKDGSRRALGADGKHIGWIDEAELGKATSTFLPAAPGWRACFLDEDGEGHWLEDIVAWQIDGIHRFATPIMHQQGEVLADTLIVAPDGRTGSLNNGPWDTLEEALAGMRSDKAA